MRVLLRFPTQRGLRKSFKASPIVGRFAQKAREVIYWTSAKSRSSTPGWASVKSTNRCLYELALQRLEPLARQVWLK